VANTSSQETRALKHCWGCGAEFYYVGNGTPVYPGLLRHWRKHWRNCLRRGFQKLLGGAP